MDQPPGHVALEGHADPMDVDGNGDAPPRIRDDIVKACTSSLEIKKPRRTKFMSFFFPQLNSPREADRRPNKKRKYAAVLRKMDLLDDNLFKRMFRLDRASFRELVDLSASPSKLQRRSGFLPASCISIYVSGSICNIPL